MKNYFAFAALTLAMSAINMAASDKDEFIAREKAVWTAFEDKNLEQIKKLASTDLLAVYPDGIYNFQQRLDSMNKIEMKSFSLSDFNLSTPSPEVAILSSKAKVEGLDGTRELNCGTVWNLNNGEWKAVFHADKKKSDE